MPVVFPAIWAYFCGVKTPVIAPSVLSADFGKLYDEVAWLEESEADWIHCDIMDGVFVPNISFGLPVLKAISLRASMPLDVHLMIERPERYVAEFAKAGADILTVHPEATKHLDRTLQAVRAEGMKTGVALNPATPVEAVRNVLYQTDLVLVMSVNPGFGGQKFIENTYAKIRRLRALIQAENTGTIIEVDGGVTDRNAPRLTEAGADALVAGNFIFGAEDRGAALRSLKRQANTIS